MKRKALCAAICLYVFAALALIVYLYIDLNPQMMIAPSERLLLLGITCLCTYLAGLLLSKNSPSQQKVTIMKTTFGVFFGLYLILLISLVLFDSYFGRVGVSFFANWSKEEFNLYISNSFNIIPFKTVGNYISKFINARVGIKEVIVNIVGNLAAFAPFAFFLPLFWSRQRKIKSFFVTTLLIVLCVELLQFILLTGVCDVDDVILNVGGAVLAYLFLHIKFMRKIISKTTRLPY